MKISRWFPMAAAALLLSSTLQAQQPAATQYSLETVAQGIDIPWGMDWLPDGDMLVTERSGRLYRIDGNGGNSEIDGLPEIHVNGQGGLLDLALHPDYQENGWIYFTFSSPEGPGDGSHTALMRARLQENSLSDHEMIYKGEGNTDRGQHYGSRIAFDGNGHVFFSIGDRGAHFDVVQDLTQDGGKIYRLHDDGRIPEDNPFVHRPDAKHAVYSYGHRNPQGMDIHPQTGQVWISEHGPRGGDEINIVKPGLNYGWPVIGYGINYNGEPLAEARRRDGVEQPVWYWDPSIATAGISFVTSDRYPDLKGHLLVGGLRGTTVELLEVHDDRIIRNIAVLENPGRVRDIRQGPDGYVYLAVENEGIMRLVE